MISKSFSRMHHKIISATKIIVLIFTLRRTKHKLWIFNWPKVNNTFIRTDWQLTLQHTDVWRAHKSSRIKLITWLICKPLFLFELSDKLWLKYDIERQPPNINIHYDRNSWNWPFSATIRRMCLHLPSFCEKIAERMHRFGK